MHELDAAFLDLLPDVISHQRFEDTALRPEIIAKTKRLAALASSLPALKAPDDGDPSTPILAELFAEHSAHALAELQHGNRQYARQMLNSTPAFCVSCHTRSGLGPDLSAPGSATPHFSDLTPIENARLLVATRQYQSALKEYDVILNAIPDEGDRSGEWRHAAYEAVTVATRVMADPTLTESIIDHILSRGFVAYSFREDVEGWKKSVVEWKKEPTQALTTEQDWISRIRALDTQASKTRVALKDRSVDLITLRITSLSHEFLRRFPKSPFSGEALLLLGNSYEVMRDWDLWTFHEVIYETCVRRSPGTDIARRCLERLESSIADDYVGETIPKAIRDRIAILRSLAGTGGKP